MRKKITTIMLAAALPVLTCAQHTPADSTRAARQDSVYKRVQLGGVTVEGRTAIQKDDHTNYMPTRRQAEASISGIGLLARMMIPKLIVNMADRSVKNADNAELSIYIDNRKADRLRPKDIVRVEHYDRPTAMFPDEQTVLNFITRKYDRGGYVDARTSTTPYPDFGKGDYSAQLGLDTKKLNVTLMAGAAYSRDESAGTRGQYGYPAFATPFSKRETPLGGLLKKRTYYGILRTTYRTDKTTAYAEVGLSRDESPAERYRSAVEYSPQVYPVAESATDRDSRSTTPTVKLFVDTKLSEDQRLKLTVNYNYHYNAYNRTYAEDGQSAVTMAADEKRNRIDASLQYGISLKHNNTLTFFLWGIYNKSHATYHGTMADDQRIGDGGVQFLPIYSHTFWKKLRLWVQPGFYWNVYEIKGYGRTSKIYGRPTVSLNYRASVRSSVYAIMADGNHIAVDGDVQHHRAAGQPLHRAARKPGA